MRNGKDKNSCLYGDELVSYIYDELTSDGRAAFENHILECSGCTAEFADISISRLGVYEWHRDEFVPLATPHFFIPYEVPQQRVPFVEAFRTFFTSPMRIGFAGASLAVVVFSFVLVTNYGETGPSVAGTPGSEPAAPVVLPSTPSEFKTAVTKPTSTQETELKSKRELKNFQPVRQARVVQAKAGVPKKRLATDAANAANAPRLASFAESEDTSLRLADLMADIDTKD